ncbi:site-specific integrase [Vibrio fluvialis]|nr:site-specific integrase [Vibrio fluvialis]
MRYLSQLKNGSWQFRFQIPAQFRELLDHKCEYKRNFGFIDKSSARLLALEHEIEIRKRMSAVVYNRQTSNFDQTFVDDIISTKGNEVKACILMCLNDIQKDVRFKNALSLAVLNASSEANESPSGCLIDVSKSGALRALRAIHPRELSAQARTDAYLDSINFDSEAKASIEYDLLNQQLRLIYQIAIKARVAIELEDFQLAYEVSQLLGYSSLDTNKCRVYLVTNAGPSNVSEQTDISLHSDKPSLVSVSQAIADCGVRKEVEQTNPITENSKIEISECLNEYKKYKYKAKARRNKKLVEDLGVDDHIEAQVRRAMVVFKLLGKRYLTDISFVDAHECLDYLFAFPSDPRNHPLYGQNFRNSDESEWIQMNQQYKLDVISSSTVIKYIEATSTIYNFAIKNYEKIINNPFRGVSSAVDTGDDINNKVPFNINDLKLIFSDPIFTERKVSYNPISKRPLNYQYWLPLSSLLLGARPNELAQSCCGDIGQEDGIFYWDLNTEHENKRLKNDGTKRKVPIHPKLISLGFLDFVKNRPKEELTFAELNYTGRDGHYRKVGEWFRRHFSKPHGFREQNKSYYSFRHTFLQFYKEHGIATHLAGSLVGHKDESMTYGTYGGEISLATKNELIEMLDFDDVLKGVKPFYNLNKTDA